jgi:hypothetical protein
MALFRLHGDPWQQSQAVPAAASQRTPTSRCRFCLTCLWLTAAGLVPVGLVSVGLVSVCLVSVEVAAAEGNESIAATEWSGGLGFGGEYDTNVSVDEVDLSSGESDYARILEFDIGVNHKFNAASKASLSYSMNQSVYSEFSRVDRLTQILGGDLSTDLGSANAGLSAYYIDSQLDNEPFLKYVRLSPSLSGFFSQRWFARGAYVYSEREIDGRAQRNATSEAAEIDLYYFHRGLRSYLNVGYRYRDEDAVAPELDFNGHALKVRYIRRFDLFGRKAKSEFAMRYEARDYRSPEPTINEPRQDDRVRWKFDFELPLGRGFTWQSYYSYGDYESNLPRADFTQTIVGTRLQLAW